ncbi:MAG TPA: caspase family protein [Pirellulaceae bacterium]|nr:caspase family protein [Pirellulaceae bacterium]HMO90722.1 caspase family protein [Pirellulaceae bacterium]HMP67973.1 caspase family protein [Pirellulaceae bacterium]
MARQNSTVRHFRNSVKRAGQLVSYFIVFALLTGTASQYSAFSQDKYAVLVGVESYNEEFLSQLNYTERDAQELAKALNALGFQTKVMTSRSRSSVLKPNNPDKILQILRTQLRSCAPGDTIIVGLSGHGLQFSDEEPLEDGSRETYFCPEDADPTDKSSLLPISQVLSLLKECQASRKLFLVDACRNDFLSTTGRRKSALRMNLGSVHETNRTIPGGLTVLFSCNETQFSWEHDELEHSVFTFFVLQYLGGNAESGYYDNDKLHLDGLVAYVRKKTNEYVFNNNLSADGQSPVLAGSSADWVIGPGINPAKRLWQKHIEFLGGEDRLRQINSFKINGRSTFFENGQTFESSYQHLALNASSLFEYVFDSPSQLRGIRMSSGATPTFSWTIDVAREKSFSNEQDHFKNSILSRYPFSSVEMLQKSKNFELGARSNINGQEVTELKMFNDDRTTCLSWYLYADGRLNHVAFSTKDINQGEIHIRDFKTVDGVKYPFHQVGYAEREKRNETTIQHVQLNVALSPDLFNVPKDLATQSSGTRANDLLDQLVDLYNSTADQHVDSWGGYFTGMSVRRLGATSVQFEYTLANGIIESSPRGFHASPSYKQSFIQDAISEEEAEVIRGFNLTVRIIVKSPQGVKVGEFDITPRDL